MKRFTKIIIVFCLIFISFILPGCVVDPPVLPDENDYEAIQNVINEIDILSPNITLNDKVNVAEIRILYDALKDSEKEYVINYEILVMAEEKIAFIEENNLKTTNELEKIKNLIFEELPDEIDSNIELPTSYESDYGLVKIQWVTDDPYTLMHTGLVVQGRTDKIVNLTATLTLEQFQTSFVKAIKVKKINFTPLPENNKVFAYMYTGSFRGEYREHDLTTINVVNLSFASLLDGEVNISSLGMFSQILSLRQASNIRVLFCIMGYSSESTPISDAASTDAGRKRLAKSIVVALEKYHFDGIDMDWEYPGYNTGRPTSVDRANYTLLMKEIYLQVKAQNSDYIVSGAVPASMTTGGLVSRYNVAEVSPYMDYLHLMTYDTNSSGTTSHHTSYRNAVLTVETYVSLGARRDQLTIGIAFYGKKYIITGSGILGTAGKSPKTINYEEISGYEKNVNNITVTKYWDETAGAPYLYIVDGTGRYFITYDDSESIALKCNYATNNGLAGVMFWEYGGNLSGDLVKEIENIYRK